MLHIFTFGAGDLSRFQYLKTSANMCGMNIHYITRETYNGYYDKIKYMLEAIQDLPNDDVVCFIDGFDLLALGTEDIIMKKFLAYKCDLLFGAELNGWPGIYTPNYPDLGIQNGYKYLNSGGFIGYTHAVKALYTWKPQEEVARICGHGSDQGYCIEYLFEFHNTRNIKLDWHQSIFQNMFSVDWKELYIKDGRIVNGILHQTPCFIHFNGDSFWTNTNEFLLPILIKTLGDSKTSPDEHFPFSINPQRFTQHYWKRSQL
jgi:hypothetical protein